MSIYSASVEKNGTEYLIKAGYTFYPAIGGNITDRFEPAYVEVHSVAVKLGNIFRVVKPSEDDIDYLEAEILEGLS